MVNTTTRALLDSSLERWRESKYYLIFRTNFHGGEIKYKLPSFQQLLLDDNKAMYSIIEKMYL